MSNKRAWWKFSEGFDFKDFMLLIIMINTGMLCSKAGVGGDSLLWMVGLGVIFILSP